MIHLSVILALTLTSITETSHRWYEKGSEYRCLIPEGWRLATQDELEEMAKFANRDLTSLDVVFLGNPNEEHQFVDNITIIRTEPVGKANEKRIAYFAQLYKNLVGREVFEYVPISASTEKSGAHAYIKLEHKLRISEESPTLHQWVAIFPLNRCTYTLTLTTIDGENNTNATVFGEIVKSFVPADDKRIYLPAGTPRYVITACILVGLLLALYRLMRNDTRQKSV